ncbi:hypothetical protein ATR1_279d0001, partial [Acetobacter tropicalis]
IVNNSAGVIFEVYEWVGGGIFPIQWLLTGVFVLICVRG